MYKVIRNDELYHYGVLGMKWGIRRRRRRDAKNAYKNAEKKAFDEYKKEISDLEKNYKRGQRLSKADEKRELDIENRYRKEVKSAKQQYKKAKKSKANDVDIANKLYGLQGEDINARVVQTKMGKTLVQSFLMTSAGALVYQSLRSSGNNRFVSAGAGLLAGTMNLAMLENPANTYYMANRLKR